MATPRDTFEGVPLDGNTVVFDPVDDTDVIRVPHPTLNVMNEIAKAREMIASQYETDGKLDPRLFLLVYMGDAWLGTREMLRRLVDEGATEEDYTLAYTYLDIGFGNGLLNGGDDAVESVSVNVLQTVRSLWDAEDEQSDADYDAESDANDAQGDPTDVVVTQLGPAIPETHVVVWALDGFDTDTGESEHATYALEAEHLPVGMYIRRGAKREGVRCLLLAADNAVVTFARLYSSSLTNMEVVV